MGYGNWGRGNPRSLGTLAAIATGAFALFASGGASAAIINLTTTADGAVSDGTGSVVVFDSGQTITATAFNGAADSFAIFEFNLSGISDTDTINSATFAFTLATNATSPVNPSLAFVVEAYLGDGAVTVADFTTVGVEVISSSVSATGPTQALAGDTLTFTLTDLAMLQSALAGDLLTLRLASTVIFNQIQIAGLEHPFSAATLTLDAVPAMQVDEVPLPAALPLMLSGLAGLGFAGRSRKRKNQA